MKKSGPGYVPCITPLTHERAYLAGRTSDEQATSPENGGWNVETHHFEPVLSYQRLHYRDCDDKKLLFVPLWQLFLDAYTVAVESGYLDRKTWQQAFRFREDWQALARDLLQADAQWMNERHRNAIVFTMLAPDDATSGFATYQDVGAYLLEDVEWDEHPAGLRLVKRRNRASSE